jgi:hypothetical protein
VRARTWLAFCGAGCVLALGYRGDWTLVAIAAADVLLALMPVVTELRGLREDAIALLLEAAQPPPAPRPEPVPCRPPWETAPVPVIPSADCDVAAGRHRTKRGLRDTVADALGAVREAYLP